MQISDHFVFGSGLFESRVFLNSYENGKKRISVAKKVNNKTKKNKYIFLKVLNKETTVPSHLAAFPIHFQLFALVLQFLNAFYEAVNNLDLSLNVCVQYRHPNIYFPKKS